MLGLRENLRASPAGEGHREEGSKVLDGTRGGSSERSRKEAMLRGLEENLRAFPALTGSQIRERKNFAGKERMREVRVGRGIREGVKKEVREKRRRKSAQVRGEGLREGERLRAFLIVPTSLRPRGCGVLKSLT